MPHQSQQKSFLIQSLSWVVEWGNKRLILSKWLFRSHKTIFLELEWMMIGLLMLFLVTLLTLHLMPHLLLMIIGILLAQRVLEFFIVYTRNFLFHRGRIYSDFHTPQKQGEWLLVMFGLNIAHLLLIFAIWYRTISVVNPESFSRPLSVLDSLYFSIVTFLTVGYGDIIPLTAFPKILVMIQSLITFYILVIVINGLISIHFKK